MKDKVREKIGKGAICFAVCGAMLLSACSSKEGEKEKSNNNTETNQTFEIKYRSGATSGCFYPVSASMAEFLPQDITGLTNVTVTPGQGQSNVQAVQDKVCDIAFAKLPGTILGVEGKEPFQSPCDKVRNLMYFYDEAFYLVVLADSGIETVEDLKGKSLSTQTVGNQAEQMTKEVLAAYNMDYSDLKKVSYVNSYDDSVQQMKDGIVDAFTFANAPPVAILTDLASTRDIKIISIEDEEMKKVLNMNKGYVSRVIPGGTYDFQERDVATFGGAVHVIANEEMDEEIAYEIVKSTVEHLTTIQEAHVTFKDLTPEKMGQELALPFHPGAERYFKEIGVIK
ncbi:TAXI family TRAP transporter solute-binding subunit [Lachnoclostridium edouardi]|uniref:TAXI family TRAP transporter solute-binding subunit n=1 Tax=Lachnoclostridium edouardi TaxID=1926283 RepID=UPI000C7BEE2C|nr:TAXI family TRAP transporter solute-binding subunit [Lachnoclostridium edouardi]